LTGTVQLKTLIFKIGVPKSSPLRTFQFKPFNGYLMNYLNYFN